VGFMFQGSRNFQLIFLITFQPVAAGKAGQQKNVKT